MATYLRQRAQGQSNATAIIDGDVELTVEHVLDESTAVSARLRAAGVEPGMVVGLLAHRGSHTLIAALAILDAGGVCLPLDPGHPHEHRATLLKDSGAGLLLSNDADRAANHQDVPHLWLDGSGPAQVHRACKRLSTEVAWILFTSGSSGHPKGVLITHRMVIARLEREPIPWQTGERSCHKTSLSFIDSIWEMFGALAQGLPVVIADEDTGRDPKLLALLLDRTGVTRVVMVPSQLSALLELPAHVVSRVRKVKHWIATGEPLSASTAERFYSVLPTAILVNLYGTTECWDIAYHIVPSSVAAGERVPVGTPLRDVVVEVLDDERNRLPPGRPGEIVVSGPCVSGGYLGKPALTAERFVMPALGSAGLPAYRTGDRGCYREDGALEVLGRQDLQVKLRGFRIEPEEIERWLRTNASVVDAAVVAVRDASGAPVSLLAYVLPREDTPWDAEGLRATLERRVPAHCIPNRFTQVARLPKTDGGKVDRQALERGDLDIGGSTLNSPPYGVEPRDEVEHRLIEIVCDVLGVERIGVTDDFFELGGDSLQAVKVTSRIEEAFATDIALRDFFDRPSIAGLAEIVRA